MESKPIRLQSPYATEDDRTKIADLWRSQKNKGLEHPRRRTPDLYINSNALNK